MHFSKGRDQGYRIQPCSDSEHFFILDHTQRDLSWSWKELQDEDLGVQRRQGPARLRLGVSGTAGM